MKVRSLFGKHNLGSAVDLQVKVRSPFGKHDLGSAVDLRVKVKSQVASAILEVQLTCE